MESSHGSFNPFNFGDQAAGEFRTRWSQTENSRNADGRKRRLGIRVKLFVDVHIVQQNQMLIGIFAAISDPVHVAFYPSCSVGGVRGGDRVHGKGRTSLPARYMAPFYVLLLAPLLTGSVPPE